MSTMAAQVIAGIPPVTLLIEERLRLYSRDDAKLRTTRLLERSTTLEKWQHVWSDHSETAMWSKTLIPDVRQWVSCKHRRLDFYLTQFLSGHGYFGDYTKRMGITEGSICGYCGEEDSPEHTIFVCQRWAAWRSNTESVIGAEVNSRSITILMMKSKENWNTIQRFVRNVMNAKRRDDILH
ncbi:unnamed protein product [Acanthoscelides obtectus]|uniref:Reverse transcriptase zinc-binding domain-containing protein n=2 Tax=Acanthoscelides obtectus TaxID=200917 RepID=A0A9P0LSZ3_ACAOB|nr:unnamed protein product [Acanthoscelides obtectus]CAK1619868.1 hypothetical protein AOBTE_LOCUS44 [Acanthoscelides obtectus]